MKANTILKVNDVESLRSLGSYGELKSCLEGELGNKLGVNGWNSLFDKIVFIKGAVSLMKDDILSVYGNKSFSESKKYLSESLGIKVKARGWQVLKLKISNLIRLFSVNAFDPYEYYETTKLKKFRDSSKLEGIEVNILDESISLESVLAKYRR